MEPFSTASAFIVTNIFILLFTLLSAPNSEGACCAGVLGALAKFAHHPPKQDAAAQVEQLRLPKANLFK